MPFLIPNEADASFVPQAAPDSTDIAAMVAGCEGTGVATGCEVTAQGTPDMTVAVAAGAVTFKTSAVQVAAGNVTVTGADATNPRKDLVVVDDAGAKSVVAGTAAADPVKPSIPADSVLLAEVYVPAGDTEIGSTQIIDKRVMVAEQFVRKTAGEAVASSTTLQADDHLFLRIGANESWEIEATLLVSASGTGDILFGWTTPTGASGALGFHGPDNGASFSGDGKWHALTSFGNMSFGGASGVTIRVSGVIHNGGTPGNLQLLWAQATSDAANTIMLTNSFIRIRRVA